MHVEFLFLTSEMVPINIYEVMKIVLVV